MLLKFKELTILAFILKKDKIQFKVNKYKFLSLLAWTIDLKNGIGSVTIGALETADASFFMSDNDFVELCDGNLDP